MTDIKALVGQRSETLKFHVTEARLKQFCEAVGAPFRGEAPPTFMTIFRDAEFKTFADQGLELSRVLHADQEYRYLDRILAGDDLEYDTTLSKALEKGPMLFLVYETEVRAKRGASMTPVGVSKTTVIVRS